MGDLASLAQTRAAAIAVAHHDFVRIRGLVRRQLGQPTLEMKLTCNIDRRGRRLRIITGAVVGVCGVAVILFSRIEHPHSIGILILGILLSIAGASMIFEGLRGWCVLRAMGMKTRI